MWKFERNEQGAPTVEVEGSQAFTEALADAVGTLAPRGREPELSTYWIDQAIESVGGLADDGQPFLSGNSTHLTVRDGSVWASSEYEIFADSSMPITTFIDLLKAWSERVDALPAADRSVPDLSPYQRNPSFTYKWIGQQLAASVPEFEPYLVEHTEYHGKVLAHVLFGDLTRFVLQQHSDGRAQVVDRCLRFLERSARYGDEGVVNLVAVSFVENVGPWDPAMHAFISTWPARLREIAAEQGWTN